MMGLSVELMYFRRHSQIQNQNFMPTQTVNRQLVFCKPTGLRKQYYSMFPKNTLNIPHKEKLSTGRH